MKVLAIGVVVAVILLLVVPCILLGGWLTMLCLGALSHIFGVAALSVGFRPATLVSLIIFVLFGK